MNKKVSEITMPFGKYAGQSITKVPKNTQRWYYQQAKEGNPITNIGVLNGFAAILNLPPLYLDTDATLPNGKEIKWQSIKTLKEVDYAAAETPIETRQEIARVLRLPPADTVLRPPIPEKQPTFIRKPFDKWKNSKPSQL